MEQITHAPLIKGNPHRCVFLFAMATGLIFASERWFFPWLRDFSARAHCEEVLGFNGGLVLFAALFIGLTLGAFIITVWLALISSRILKSGQMPPPGTWVCRDSVPKTGRSVKWQAYFGLGLPLVGIAFVGWGVLTFADLKKHLLDPGLKKAQRTCVMKHNLTRHRTHQTIARHRDQSLQPK